MYYVLRMPLSVVKRIDKILWNFLWDSNEEKKIHWVGIKRKRKYMAHMVAGYVSKEVGWPGNQESY